MRVRIARILLGVAAGVAASGLAAQSYPARGPIPGVAGDFSGTLDHELAAYYLETCRGVSACGKEASEAAVRIRSLLLPSDRRVLDRDLLRELTGQVSVDFATLYFMSRIQGIDRHRLAQDLYHAEFRCIRTGHCTDLSAPLIGTAARSAFRILAVGGFHYKSDPHTGADLAGPRRFLARYDFAGVDLADTAEDGGVEENARLIAAQIRNHQGPEKLILVSTSKGGPEVAWALGHLLTPEEAGKVAAWVSVGGLLRGTILADQAVRWYRWWLTRLVFWYLDLDPVSIPELTTTASIRRLGQINIPGHISIIHYVGVPFRSQISSAVGDRFERLSSHGPNDGLTLLTDELLPQGHVVMEQGVDHFFRARDLNFKALALAHLAMRLHRQQPIGHP